MPRRIDFHPEFNEAAKAIAPKATINTLLLPITDAVQRNPRAFKSIEIDGFGCRYVITRPTLGLPALVLTFEIDKDDDVLFTWIEEHRPY
jgi:hypothetical protein